MALGKGKAKKTKKKKKVTAPLVEEVVEAADEVEKVVETEVTPEETVDSQSEKVVEENPLYEAVLIVGQSYEIGGIKFRRNSPQPVRDPALIEKLDSNSSFSVHKVHN